MNPTRFETAIALIDKKNAEADAATRADAGFRAQIQRDIFTFFAIFERYIFESDIFR